MDAYLHGVLGGLRVTLRDVVGQKGLGGVCSLLFHLELLPTGGPVSETSMLIQGQFYVGPQGGGMYYVAPVQMTSNIGFGGGPLATTQLAADVTKAQLEAIERDVRGEHGIRLVMNVNGMTLTDEKVSPFFGQMAWEIDAAKWLGVLEQCGYGSRVVAHLPSEGP